MKKIILIYPKTLYEEGIQYYHVPYSVLSIAANMTDFNIRILDSNIQTRLEISESLKNELASDEILCLGVSSMMGHQIRDALSISALARETKPNVPIVWGGALPTILPELTIQHELVDFIVRGQGERTFAELIYALDHQLDINQIAGISYKSGNSIVHNPMRSLIDLDRFPPFSTVYHMIDVRKYIRDDPQINSRTISYHSSQGCVFDCAFCCEGVLWGRRWLALSVERILHDIVYLISEYNINGIKFYDSEFFINKRRALEFAETLIHENINIRWGAAIHPKVFSKFDSNELEVFSRSGLSRLMIGAESIIKDEIDLIGKGTNPELLVQMARLCSNFNISACFSFIVGFPGSSETTIGRTLDFARRIREIDSRHEVPVNFFAPYPGTRLYPLALENGFIPPKTLDEWSWYDYRLINTPWVNPSYEETVRKFNEENYPFLRGSHWNTEKNE